MKRFNKASAVIIELKNQKANGKSIGFVPTMGALHQGHLELVKKSIDENDITIVSIFVNPTQFNNSNDLTNYPRTLLEDTELLENCGCDFLFVPTVEEIYPEPDKRIFDFGNLSNVMEGKFRAGHFNGVAQVVSKLLEIAIPDNAYFGEKDFQQLAVIRQLVDKYMPNCNTKIVACATVRESDGLAMSSRNKRLTANQRIAAPIIAESLFDAKENYRKYNVNELKTKVINFINANPHLEVEYFEIANAYNLVPIENWDDAKLKVACIAVNAGDVRLIDNIKL